MSDSSAAESGRTALRVAAVVLLVLVVAPFVVTGVPSVVGAEESFVVLSGSMNEEPEPIIQPGDVVIVDGVDPASIEEQDIITFTTGGEEPVTHRVVNVTEQDGQVAFRTKGDANEDADQQLIGPDQTIGKVIFVIPLIGHVVNFANTTQGFVLLVLLPIGLLVLSEAWNLVVSAGGSDEESGEPGEPGRGPVGTADTAGAAHAAGAGAAADGADDDDDDGPATVSLGRTQVGWVTVGLVPIVAATGYVAFRLQTAWILTAFFASVGLTILSGLLYLRIKWGSSEPEAPTGSAQGAEAVGRPPGATADPEDETASSSPVTTVRPVVEDGVRRNPVVTGRVEESLENGSHVEVSVDSREELVEMAIEKGTWVVNDTETGAYVLVDDGMLFRYDSGDGTVANGSVRSVGATASDGPGPNGDSAAEPDAEWEEASGWITFSEEATGDTSERGNGSGTDDHGRSAAEERDEGNLDDHDPEGIDGDGEVTEDPEEVDEDDESMPSWDEDLTPAIRRIEEGEAADDAVEPPAGVDADEQTDGSVRTDGGSSVDLPVTVRKIGRAVRLPTLVLGFVGYLIIEPPRALYLALRSKDGRDASRTQSGGHSEEES